MSSYFRMDVCSAALTGLASYCCLGYSALFSVAASAAAFFGPRLITCRRSLSLEEQAMQDLFTESRKDLDALRNRCQGMRANVYLSSEERARIVKAYNRLNIRCRLYEWGGDFQRDLEDIYRRIPPQSPTGVEDAVRAFFGQNVRGRFK